MLLSGANRTRLAILGGAALLLFYAWVLFGRVATAVGGSESSGCFGAARMIVAGSAVQKLLVVDRLGLDPTDASLFVPQGFVPGERAGTAVPLYPPGFPLHVAAVALLLGWTAAPFFIPPIAALLALELVYAISRELKLSRLASVTATVVFAACPVFVFHSIQPTRDVVATFWCLASVWAALVSRRGSAAWAVAAGLALGVAVLVRPSSVVILPAVLVALRWRRPTGPFFLLGALPPLLVLGLYDQAVYGGWTRTGFQIGGLGGAFSAPRFPGRIASYLESLARTMTPLLVVGAVAAVADRKVSRRDRILLVLWWGGFLVFHSFHDPYGAWWHVSSLLPGIPAMVLACLMAWRDFVAHPLGAARRPALAAALSLPALAAVLLVEIGGIFSLGVLDIGRRQNVYLAAAQLAERYVPDEGLVLSAEMSGALNFYSYRAPVRWDRLDPQRFERLRERAAARGRRWYALLAPDELEGAKRAAPGRWVRISGVPGRDVTLWRIEN